MKRYPLFDYLRLFLALEVVMIHFQAFRGSHEFGAPINPVPAFLAISGFLVLQSFENSPSWGRFAWKRFCRIIPAFVASLAVIGLLFGGRQVFLTVREWATLGLVHGSINGPVWSLMAEEIAYVILAVLSLSGAYR